VVEKETGCVVAIHFPRLTRYPFAAAAVLAVRISKTLSKLERDSTAGTQPPRRSYFVILMATWPDAMRTAAGFF
jgi:hypothetical protein